jgi:ribulose-5-phosphate 4-epimerase/fuculose-1-phosphate aldolase
MHTHTRAGAGLSTIRGGLRPISQDALHVLDDVIYHDYGVPASKEECEELGRSCATGSCVVLLNHGLLTLGHTVHGALMRLYMLERACEVEIIARQLGEPPVMIEDYIIERASSRMKKMRLNDDYGRMEWDGLVRQVDRKGFNYRR